MCENRQQSYLDFLNFYTALWAKLQQLSQPPTTQQVQHTATDLMTHFVGKVQKIHASTAGADVMSTVKQSDVELSTFQPVTSDHVLQLLRKTSNTHCPLDPAPTCMASKEICSSTLACYSCCLQCLSEVWPTTTFTQADPCLGSIEETIS